MDSPVKPAPPPVTNLPLAGDAMVYRSPPPMRPAFTQPEYTIAANAQGFAEYIYAWANRKKFYEEGVPFNFAEKLMLVVTELAEACEADRRGTIDNPDEHCPEFNNGEIELADAIIRLLDLSAAKKYRIGAALIAKMRYNESREIKHGKKY